jgi:hypothetical protein
MDQFRSNPRELEQRYSQSKDLLDLLALQKLKGEKEATKRQMQMQMQTNPNTIIDQREQEVSNLSREELAGQVGGTNNQRMKMVQDNMQKMASANVPGAQPSQPSSNQTNMSRQGIAAAAPQNMKFSEGGVVPFQEGGKVESEITAKVRKALGEGASAEEVLRLFKNPDHVAIAKRAMSLQEPEQGGNVPYGKEFDAPEATGIASVAPDRSKPMATRIPTADWGKIGQAIKSGLNSIGNRAESSIQPTFDKKKELYSQYVDTPAPKTGETGGIASVAPAPMPQPAAPTAVAPENQPMVEDLYSRMMVPPETQPNVAAPQPQAQPQAAPEQAPVDELMQMADAVTREQLLMSPDVERERGIAAMRDVYAPQQALIDKSVATSDRYDTARSEQMDPEKLKREQLFAALRGAAGRPGGFGQVMARAGAAGANTRADQEARSLNTLKELAGLQNTNVTQQGGIADALGKEGSTRYGTAVNANAAGAESVRRDRATRESNALQRLGDQERNAIMRETNALRSNTALMEQAIRGEVSVNELAQERLDALGVPMMKQQLARMETGSKEHTEMATQIANMEAAVYGAVQGTLDEYRRMRERGEAGMSAATVRPGFEPDAFR